MSFKKYYNAKVAKIPWKIVEYGIVVLKSYWMNSICNFYVSML